MAKRTKTATEQLQEHVNTCAKETPAPKNTSIGTRYGRMAGQTRTGATELISILCGHTLPARRKKFVARATNSSSLYL